MASFGEVLASFKDDEAPENICPLVEDETLRNGIVAWKSVAIRYKEAEDCEYKDDTSKWNWLWTRVDYDVQRFGTVAGVNAQGAAPMVTRLIGLRLIYPDGTISTYATQYLQSIIMAKLKKK